MYIYKYSCDRKHINKFLENELWILLKVHFRKSVMTVWFRLNQYLCNWASQVGVLGQSRFGHAEALRNEGTKMPEQG
jgi:hypothetical protein